MMEIGGFLELDKYTNRICHSEDIALNSGRNCLAYLIRKKDIRKVWVPKFLCASVWDICKREGAEISFYSIDENFRPVLSSTDEWVYLVNYYGQISNEEIECYKVNYPNLIVDNVQAYFQEPVSGIDTIYTCRKFFGVTDGAFLHSDVNADNLGRDVSYERMKHILGRFECSASELYGEYLEREKEVGAWPILKMSRLTENLLRGISYDTVSKTREENFNFLNEHLGKYNRLKVKGVPGPYMYPLYVENGGEIRKRLLTKKIYIPTLWPDVFEICDKRELEYDMSENILPLPCDQRYDMDVMKYMVGELEKNLVALL